MTTRTAAVAIASLCLVAGSRAAAAQQPTHHATTAAASQSTKKTMHARNARRHRTAAARAHTGSRMHPDSTRGATAPAPGGAPGSTRAHATTPKP